MPIPKSVVKVKTGEVEYTSSVDRVCFTMDELVRGALRDSGKFICNTFRTKFYQKHKKKSGNVGKFTQYWVRSKAKDLQVGIKNNAFYGGFNELGTSKQPKEELLKKSVEDNIPKIIEIQSKYLSALEDEAKALSLINENDLEGL